MFSDVTLALVVAKFALSEKGLGVEIYKADVVIVGGGGSGLRAAIAVAEADPSLKIALVSKG